MDNATKCQTHDAQRLIDVNALKEAWKYVAVDGATLSYIYGLFKSVDDAPTIDAVEVVRCRNCIYSRDTGDYQDSYFCGNRTHAQDFLVHSLDYCSYGERSE